MRFPTKITSSFFGLPYLLIELFYIGIPVVRTNSRSNVRSPDYQNFSDGQFTKFSSPWCSAARAKADTWLSPFCQRLDTLGETAVSS